MRRSVLVCLLVALPQAFGFALLGPFENWQVPALGYNTFGNDAGGPKNLGEEYRWNIPTIRYAFDASFNDYFGEHGVEAVTAAMEILNDLPPAAQVDPAAFPPDTRRLNLRASEAGLIDLKSTVLSLLLEGVGLAVPERYAWTLRDRRLLSNEPFGPASQTNYLVVNRNFDPISFLPSPSVNGLRLTYSILEMPNPPYADAVESSLGDQAHFPSSVASFTTANGFRQPPVGVYLLGLTADDVGGLRYLLHPTNQNIEDLPAGAFYADAPSEVSTLRALRPGVDKLRFEPVTESWESIQNWSMTAEWTDLSLVNGAVRQRPVRRILTRPDIIFSAADLGAYVDSVQPVLFRRDIQWTPAFSPGSFSGGPGTITAARITLAKLGVSLFNAFPGATSEAGGSLSPVPRWASFDNKPGDPIIYPQPFAATPPRVSIIQSADRVHISLAGHSGASFQVEKSTDLRTWTVTEVLSTNNNFTLDLSKPNGSAFFRARRLL